MTSLPGAEITIGRSCEDGDVYSGEWRLRGTNTRPIVKPDGSQIPPTGKSVDVQGMECTVFSGDGSCSTTWSGTPWRS